MFFKKFFFPFSEKSFIFDKKIKVMDLATRKYNFIRELVDVDKENIIETLERVLKQKKS